METGRRRVQVACELRELIPRFLANRRIEVEELRDAVARGDLEGARRIGHVLKGVGGGYGFSEISRIGTEIERGACAGSHDLATLVCELSDYLDGVEITYTT